jgi:hypothetical protein
VSLLKIGSLFTGTGALDLAVMDVYDAEVVWHSQYEPPDKNGKEDTQPVRGEDPRPALAEGSQPGRHHQSRLAGRPR